jgi:hypothetical protein
MLPVPSQINPVHNLLCCPCLLFSHICLDLPPSLLFPCLREFRTHFACLQSPAYSIYFDSIILTIFGEYILRRSSLCNYIPLYVTSFLSFRNILLNIMFSNILFPQCERPSFTPIQRRYVISNSRDSKRKIKRIQWAFYVSFFITLFFVFHLFCFWKLVR